MMNKLKCVIVDDEPMAREIIASYIDKSPNLELLESCKNASEAIVFMQDHKADLFFLDINMPEINGLSLAKIINSKGQIIFTTAYRDYAVDGFNLNVVDYLLKPISFDRFLEAVQKVSTPEIIKNDNDFMFVRADRKMVKIDFNSILYIESLSDYVKIFTTEKTTVIRETISSLQEKLPAKKFIRIHRSFIISFKKIDSYTNEFIEINQKALPISRSYKESVLQKLAEV
ncbi:DNA-binding response regulator [Polaribacter vadi]|uniref:Two-component system response regulator n=1 Tax=Polaribacter vadi TaxID=1774273 RepID=A0A1B8U338_9FLAO|nr:LytTR family DNA-binding domain-containing protein [Polaribacter vadi]AOW17324.1 DNA-binding response regulator [Polaribacter vadi]OBY66261.1 two-component system response regulator [Polaribacter vadi]